ncbi:hypothetical protein M378DRAFT_38970, partial [Amanita muscaria Koide BX008]
CVTGLSIYHLGERFQRSNDTISKYFRRMLIAFSSHPFFTKYVQLPCSTDPTPPEILNNPKFYPYFANTLGALDGTHIACSPSAADRESARNRK